MKYPARSARKLGVTLKQFLISIHAEIDVKEHPASIFVARIKGAKIKGAESLESQYGVGGTAMQAVRNYQAKISRKKIVLFSAHPEFSQTVSVPMLRT